MMEKSGWCGLEVCSWEEGYLGWWWLKDAMMLMMMMVGCFVWRWWWYWWLVMKSLKVCERWWWKVNCVCERVRRKKKFWSFFFVHKSYNSFYIWFLLSSKEPNSMRRVEATGPLSHHFSTSNIYRMC